MERRSNQRFRLECQTTVIARRNDAHGSAEGKFCDISNSGIRILIGLALEPGESIEVLIGDSTLYGLVAHCEQQGSSFEIGAKVEKVKLGDQDLSGMLKEALTHALPGTPGLGA